MTIDPERANNDSPLQMALKLPFNEAATFFQNKLNIPTQKWDDLWKGQHAKGFMVAGAYKADLLSDFYTAVDKAVTKGVSLETFRKDFDSIVAKHGWSYNGSRDWRSEIIYSTNVRQAYNAFAVGATDRSRAAEDIAVPDLQARRQPAPTPSSPGLERDHSPGKRSLVGYPLPAKRLGLQMPGVRIDKDGIRGGKACRQRRCAGLPP